MKTPIDDFVKKYADSGAVRLHMPGHKGMGETERLDITEIGGADSLYHAEGIIAESEANATQLFGAPTFYSTEGSSQCIRAMLYLAALDAARAGKKPRIAAGRNAHSTFVSAVALLDIDVDWLMPEGGDSYLSCPITPDFVEQYLEQNAPSALYITSPDYLGNTVDIGGIARACHSHGVLLLVDNAHGAYLKFLSPSRHPMDAGADMCCDSAHKTLPTLTGGAYLHVREGFAGEAKQALSLFGSTSPSYLILASLDRTNRYLSEGYVRRLAMFCAKIAAFRALLAKRGLELWGDEPLKLTIAPRSYGYTGRELADILCALDLVPEFSDPDCVVLMLSPDQDTTALEAVLKSLPRREGKKAAAPKVCDLPQRVMTPRQAIMSPSELLPAVECVGRVAAALTVGCPPAVPVVVSGERVDACHIPVLEYYGIRHLRVVKE